MKVLFWFCVMILDATFGIAQIYESYKDVPQSVDFNGSLGFSLDIDGEWAVVGAPNESVNGAIHIYRRVDDQWIYFQKRTPSDQPDGFGERVAVEGNVIAVASDDDDQLGPIEGSVYIYRFNIDTWNFNQKIYNPSEVLGGFGTDVAFNDGNLFVGSGSNLNPQDYGIFIYEQDGNDWVMQDLIQVPDSLEASCGRLIEVEGDILIGSIAGDNESVENSGACCYFKMINGEWLYQQKIKASDPQSFSSFGQSIDINSERLLIGANTHDETVANVGAVYYYELEDDVFVEKQKISPESLSDGIRFGNAVATADNKLIIGAGFGLNDLGIITGEAYSYGFDGTQWNLLGNLLSSDGELVDAFGSSVGIFNESVIIGSFGNDEGAEDGGAVYFYEDVFVGIDQEENSPSINIYPNPTRDFLRITLPENTKEMQYQIVNMNGQFLQNGVLNNFNNSLDVSILSPGIYNIVLTNDRYVVHRKFVVVR